ncbi:MAG: hypothetical protein H0W89_02725 [Candidatus Levybacteria bacterium]|nr:hypothetical protein [Candidatus Levybacteria bacterium]
MRDQMKKSRLISHLQKQAYKNVLLACIGIILVIILLIIFGTNILVSFSLLVGKLTGVEETAITTQSDEYIAPPTLNAAPEATSSAAIIVTGYGQPDQRIDLYRNDTLINKTTVKSTSSFRFTGVTLVEGSNIIKARAANSDNKQSNFSNEVKTSFLKNAPDLTVDFPQNDQGFKKEESPVKVTGKTDSGAQVTINDFWAIVDAEGNYSYLYNLKDGDNPLKVVATDNAGNKTEKELKIRIE